ncbi:hypothetical protein VFPPC_01550 [Pochonia chlamydosporia 170]|uniref:Uncharacterized protein n=1 Tax=Pochonia chlamydosporia 170 TaxID=1380566 RepID=A0A179G824_METCM|nr:hypothetical protein VFPPC_01550 [Pochonia chlamydosporia 170]OAQ73945.1 hypothetical protein VFPPC_01550 [Pochonia chlamydosporia 170]
MDLHSCCHDSFEITQRDTVAKALCCSLRMMYDAGTVCSREPHVGTSRMFSINVLLCHDTSSRSHTEIIH